MNRPPILDHDLKHSGPATKTSTDDGGRDLLTPTTPDPTTRTAKIERSELASHSHGPEPLGMSGEHDETKGLKVLRAIIFGILIMAILGAVITLAFVAN